MNGYALIFIFLASLAGQPPAPTATEAKSRGTPVPEVEEVGVVVERPAAVAVATLSPMQKLFENTLRKAQELYEEEKFDEALVLYNKAIEIDRTSAEPYIRAGSCYYTLKKIDKAIEMLKRASELDPANSFIYYKLGQCYAAREQWDLAIVEYEKAVKDNPKNAFAHFELGSAQFIKRDFAKAKEHYEEAAKLFGYDTPQGEESLRNAIKVEMLMERI